MHKCHRQVLKKFELREFASSLSECSNLEKWCSKQKRSWREYRRVSLKFAKGKSLKESLVGGLPAVEDVYLKCRNSDWKYPSVVHSVLFHQVQRFTSCKKCLQSLPMISCLCSVDCRECSADRGRLTVSSAGPISLEVRRGFYAQIVGRNSPGKFGALQLLKLKLIIRSRGRLDKGIHLLSKTCCHPSTCPRQTANNWFKTEVF